MNILVTGSDGFLGRHVVKLAEERGHEVEQLDLKTQIPLSALPAYWFNDYDCIIHLAAYIDITESIREPWKYVENNLLTLKKFKGAKRLVFASSAAVYGDFSPYGYTKRLGEALLPQNSISLRMFNPFGPGENHKPENHIIPKLIEACNIGVKASLYQEGKQVRDFIWVEDAAMAFVLAAESDATGAYDLCDTPLQIRQVADYMGAPYELVSSERDSADADVLRGDKQDLERAINWRPNKNVIEQLKNWKQWA